MALLLAKHGYKVTIIDAASDVMMRASNSQEGKVHLGMVYSMDRSMRTGRKMLIAALNFAKGIEYLVGKTLDWSKIKTGPFHYVVPFSSHLTPDELDKYFSQLEEIYHETKERDSSLSYLGERPERLIWRTSLPSCMNQTYFNPVAFLSEERAVSHNAIRAVLKEAFQEYGIDAIFNTRVLHVSRMKKATKDGSMFRVETTRGVHNVGGPVINCLWEVRRLTTLVVCKFFF